MSHGPVQIVLVEDEQKDAIQMRAVLRQMLTTTGLDLTHLEDGETLLETIETMRPDIVLLDYMLPGRNGLELLDDIMARFPGQPVIMVTGFGDETVAVEAMHKGAMDYVSKASLDGPTLVRALFRAMAIGRYSSERSAADLRASQHEQTMDALFGATSQAIIALDRHGGIMRANPSAWELLEWSVGDVKDKNFHDLTHRFRPPEDHHDPHTCPLELSLMEHRSASFRDDYVATGTGTFIPCTIKIVPTAGGPRGETLVFLEPLIARNASADRLLERLRKREQEQTDMLNVVSHLLQTPLTPMMMRLALLHRQGWDEMNPKQQDGILTIERSARRMHAVIETSIIAKRLRSGRQRIHPTLQPLAPIVSDTAAALQDLCRERTVTLMPVDDDVCPPDLTLNIDGDALRQALHSVLRTAIQRSPPDHLISWACKATEDDITLTFAGGGPPMSADEILGMLDPFSFLMIDTSSGEAAERTLWFYVARLFIEAHGGTLDLTPTGAGTTYTIALPIAGPRAKVGATQIPGIKARSDDDPGDAGDAGEAED